MKSIQTRPFAGQIESPINNDSDVYHDIDKVHAKMSKFALGVNKYTSNTAVFRELGQFPVSIQAKVLAVMYFYRLNREIDSDSNVLLSAAYNCMKDFSHPWISSMSHFFAVNGFYDLYDKIIGGGVTKGMIKSQVKKRLSDIFIQDNMSRLNEREHLSELRELVDNTGYNTQKYLKIISSPQLRNIYSRVRTNSSKLSPNPYSAISENCETCGVIKNFKHVLLQCKNYNRERDKFVTQMSNAGCNVDPLSDNFYRVIMSLDFSDCPKEYVNSVTPIILSYVGVIGRKCAI